MQTTIDCSQNSPPSTPAATTKGFSYLNARLPLLRRAPRLGPERHSSLRPALDGCES
jgi:hypothetical protein